MGVFVFVCFYSGVSGVCDSSAYHVCHRPLCIIHAALVFWYDRALHRVQTALVFACIRRCQKKSVVKYSAFVRLYHIISYHSPTMRLLTTFSSHVFDDLRPYPYAMYWLESPQLFMVPEFREGVLGFRDNDQTPPEDSLMWQLQNMFSHLQVRAGVMVW